MNGERSRGRPPGMQHDAAITIRLPKAAYDALRRLAKMTKLSVAAFVRAGVSNALAGRVAGLVATASNESVKPGRRLAAVAMLQNLRMAAFAMSPLGLEMARREAEESQADDDEE